MSDDDCIIITVLWYIVYHNYSQGYANYHTIHSTCSQNWRVASLVYHMELNTTCNNNKLMSMISPVGIPGVPKGYFGGKDLLARYWAQCTERIRDVMIMRCTNLLFTYLLTYLWKGTFWASSKKSEWVIDAECGDDDKLTLQVNAMTLNLGICSIFACFCVSVWTIVFVRVAFAFLSIISWFVWLQLPLQSTVWKGSSPTYYMCDFMYFKKQKKSSEWPWACKLSQLWQGCKSEAVWTCLPR